MIGHKSFSYNLRRWKYFTSNEHKSKSRRVSQTGSISLHPEGRNSQYHGNRKEVAHSSSISVPESEAACRVEIDAEATEYWWIPFLVFLELGRLRDELSTKVEARRRATKFVVLKACCMVNRWTTYATDASHKTPASISEVHCVTSGAHQSGPELHIQLKSLGYYWSTMIRDCMISREVYKATARILAYYHPSWPLAAWGNDVVGPFGKATNWEYKYILADTDDSSKQVKAIQARNFTMLTTLNFIQVYIIY